MSSPSSNSPSADQLKTLLVQPTVAVRVRGAARGAVRLQLAVEDLAGQQVDGAAVDGDADAAGADDRPVAAVTWPVTWPPAMCASSSLNSTWPLTGGALIATCVALMANALAPPVRL